MNTNSTPVLFNRDFEFVCRNQAEGDEKLREMMKDIDRMQSFVNSILAQCAKIDSSISQFRENVESVSKGMAGISNALMYVSSKKNSSRGTGIALGLGLLGMGVNAIGGFIASKREAKAAVEKKRQMMDAALENKKKVALTKLIEVEKNRSVLYNKMMELQPEYNRIKSLSATESESWRLKVSYFARVFIMYSKVKAGYLALDYVAAEMKAWLAGKHDSYKLRVGYGRVLRDEIDSWTGGKRWGEWLKSLYESQEPTLPIPAVWMASEPALFANAIGYRNPLLDYTDKAFLSAEDVEGDSFMWRLTKENPYYATLKNQQKDFVYPKRPWYVNGIDILTILASSALTLLGTFWACGMERGLFKVLCLILVFIGIVIFVENVSYLTLRRWEVYTSRCDEIERDTVKKLSGEEANAGNREYNKIIIYY